ncbi:SDR family NAD(P)-dependent oxidoreductase [Kitasatospora sp. NPDC092948]|uniref:SDR family NAD(P)-dependent oxidoreductase n=1 Tax=Kitasatospora sp. NPDC092948 TaxID=3364088 RepID=UPI00380CA004
MDALSLKGRTAVVTGANRGLGESVAEALLARGARVVCAARDEAAAEPLLALGGDRVLFHKTDVRDPDSVERAMAAAVDRFGGLDIVVANAAVNAPGPVAAISPEAWSEAVTINLSGTYHCLRAAVPLMRERGWGRIITLSSALSSRPMPGAGAYCATKAAVEALTRVAALEVAADGITVNCLSPGVTDRGMGQALAANERLWGQFLPKLASGRPGRGEEIGAVAAFLAGEESSYVNGAVIEVDGGLGH